MFVVRTLIEKYAKQSNSRLVTCFIDFKKAFDSVSYQGAFPKMQTVEKTGLFMKIGHGMTDAFHSEIGHFKSQPV